MSAYGKYKVKSAAKMYMKSQNVPFEIANEVTKQIEAYEMELKYHKDDAEDDDDVEHKISIDKFVSKEYIDMIDASKKYVGLIDSVSPHPCAQLILNGDIRELIGVSRTSTGLICNIDGKMADKYKYLKEDILTVSVVDIIDKVFKRIGIDNWKQEYPSAKLKELVKGDEKVWDIYSKGITMTINQVEGISTAMKAMKYKPQNIEELCAFVAAIRPSAASIYSKFEHRDSFKYGIDLLDESLDIHLSGSFILYQEQIMNVLGIAGIPQSRTYEIIKAISKKKTETIMAAKEDFMRGFVEKLMGE
jgi:DNA polymerase III alpha subunit